MKCLLLIFFLPFESNSKNIVFGLSVPFSLKTNIINDGDKYSLLYSTGIYTTLNIKGMNDNSLSFQQNIGLFFDKINYKADVVHENIGVKTTSIFLSSDIIIPTKFNHFNCFIGIGSLFIIDNSVYSGGQYAQSFSSSLSQSEILISEKIRKIVPQVSIGINYTQNTHFDFQLYLTHSLTNYFDSNAQLIYQIQGVEYHKNVSYQPTYLGVKAIYFFKKKGV